MGETTFQINNVSQTKRLKRKYPCSRNRRSSCCSCGHTTTKYDEYKENSHEDEHHHRFSWIKFLNFSFAMHLVHILSIHVYYPDKRQVSHAILLIPRLCKSTVSYTYHVFFGRMSHMETAQWLRKLSRVNGSHRSAIYKLLNCVYVLPSHVSPLLYLILGQAFQGVKKCSHLCRRRRQQSSSPGKYLCPSIGWQVKCYRMIPLKSLSTAWGWANSFDLPLNLRTPVLSWYIKIFNCNLSEAEVQDLTLYRNLGEFFRRNLKCGVRPIDSCSPIIIPADGQILHFGKVDDGIDEVKGVYYSLAQFLGPQTWDENKNLQPFHDNNDTTDFGSQILHHQDGCTSLFHCVIYLAPGDYHKFHSPCQWKVNFRRHFAGELLSVNPTVARLINGLFSLNERAVYIGEWEHGFCSLTAVGATNVGSIKVYEDPDLQTNVRRQQKGQYHDHHFEEPLIFNKGEKFGEFNLGSTIVLIFEAPTNFKFKQLHHGMKVKLGETLRVNENDPSLL